MGKTQAAPRCNGRRRDGFLPNSERKTKTHFRPVSWLKALLGTERVSLETESPLMRSVRARPALRRSSIRSAFGQMIATQRFRSLLVGALLASPFTSLNAQRMGPRDVDKLPVSEPTLTQQYGAEALQFGELRLPAGAGPFPVAIVIHGGCWTKGFATVRNTAPIATALARNKIATWNIEYRQVGDTGGGWPGTFLDWGAAADHVRVLAKSHPLDLARVIVVGHSAGAHAALWVAARHRLPADSAVRQGEPLPISAAVAIDGPCDLIGFVGFDARVCGGPVVAALMGGTPAAQPERYRQASPPSLLPLGVPQFVVGSSLLTPAKAQEYQKSAQAKGDKVEVLSLPTGHFEVIAPGHEAWKAVESLIVRQALETANPGR
jgi:acetyl esterase/lipase